MSNRKTILMLEDNDDRIDGFRAVVSKLSCGLQLKVWHDAPAMLQECSAFFQDVCLFSLDHDLNPQPGAIEDPGCGLDVALFLSKHKPICAVLIHSSNYERAWSMHNEFRFAGWQVDRIGPLGDDWIHTLWQPKVCAMLNLSLG